MRLKLVIYKVLFGSMLSSICGIRAAAQFPMTYFEVGYDAYVLQEMLPLLSIHKDTIRMVTYHTRRVKKDSVGYRMTYIFINNKLCSEQEQSLSLSDDYRHKFYEYDANDITKIHYANKKDKWVDYTLWKDTTTEKQVEMKVNNEHLLSAKLDNKKRITLLYNKPEPKKTPVKFNAIFGMEKVFTMNLLDSVQIKYKYSGLLRKRISILQKNPEYMDEKYYKYSVRALNGSLLYERVDFSYVDNPREVMYEIRKAKSAYEFKTTQGVFTYKLISNNVIEVTIIPINEGEEIRYSYVVE